MSKLDLNKREFGAWFAPFEHDLIFAKKQEHIGWVVHTSDKSFKLQLTPFFEQYRDYLYIVPEPKLLPPQKMCVEIKPLQIIREPVINNKSLYGEYKNYCIVDGFKEYIIRKQKLNMGYKDFLYHCTADWKNAEDDDLDIMLGLQMVSCPSAFYGKGGVGTLASKLSSYGKLTNKIVPQLNNTYNKIIAPNFHKINDKYFFSMIKTPREINAIKTMQRHGSCEVNYCRPCLSIKDALKTVGTVPIQIPILIKNAEYVQSNNLAEPYLLLQYQLTSLMYNPGFGDSNSSLKTIDDNIKKVIEKRMLENVFEIDGNTINKLAMSFCRLYLTDDVSSKEISNATDTFFANWNDWKHYLNESKELTDFRSSAHPQDATFKFSHDHQRFLVELQKIHDENNEKWIDRKAIEERLDTKIRIMAYDIAVDLNNAGYIIQQNNFSKLRKVMDVFENQDGN